MLATDRPFVETKRPWAGSLSEAENLDGVLEIANQIPTLPYRGVVEVRPVVDK